MHNFKKTACAAVIAAIVLVLLLALDFALYPCTFIRNDIHAVTTETFDDIYLGTSHGKMNIDPAVIEEEAGRTGHNLCVGGEYSIDTYYMAQLITETGHRPQRIVYEVSPGYFVREKEEGNNYLLFYHEFPMTRAKLDYFRAAVAKCNLRTLFFPWYEYPLSYELEHLGETLSRKMNRDYGTDSLKTDSQEYHENGFIERYPVDPEEFSFDGMDEPWPEDILPENMAYLERLIGFCREQGIEFVAVTTPLPEDTLEEFADGYEAIDTYYADFFEGQQVRYINFNTDYYDWADHSIECYTDLDGHMNGDAAREFSRALSAALEGKEMPEGAAGDDGEEAGESVTDETIGGEETAEGGEEAVEDGEEDGGEEAAEEVEEETGEDGEEEDGEEFEDEPDDSGDIG